MEHCGGQLHLGRLCQASKRLPVLRQHDASPPIRDPLAAVLWVMMLVQPQVVLDAVVLSRLL
jgi:hypothetical protein